MHRLADVSPAFSPWQVKIRDLVKEICGLVKRLVKDSQGLASYWQVKFKGSQKWLPFFIQKRKGDKMEKLVEALAFNDVIRLVIIAVVMDTIFGAMRAVKEHRFNSCVGIDGAIRKISMVVSLVFLTAIDLLIHVNLIGFIPEEVRNYFPASIIVIGLAEFFGLLYLCYEAVSILKNMALCGLPVKKLWETVRNFLNKYTEELPDTDELEKQEESKDE